MGHCSLDMRKYRSYKNLTNYFNAEIRRVLALGAENMLGFLTHPVHTDEYAHGGRAYLNWSKYVEIPLLYTPQLNPDSMGIDRACNAKFSSHNNNTALIHQISLFDTALVMTLK